MKPVQRKNGSGIGPKPPDFVLLFHPHGKNGVAVGCEESARSEVDFESHTDELDFAIRNSCVVYLYIRVRKTGLNSKIIGFGRNYLDSGIPTSGIVSFPAMVEVSF